MILRKNGGRISYVTAIEQDSMVVHVTMLATVWFILPPISDINAFIRDATKFSYKLQCWYAPEFSVVNMIQQYSGIVKIPTFGDLNLYCIFPPRIMALAGEFQSTIYHH